ncbi:MAG: hypothetical protein NZL96_01760 [Patescibacteria group bacterium]|nr:hypothetical protein [Patescibacteria group bacterium]
MEKRLFLTLLVLSLIIIIFAYILINSSQKNNQKLTQVELPSKEKIIYYYGEGCPHCRDVEEWLAKNNIEKKINLEKKEVWRNRANAEELIRVARNCGLNQSSIGVPFLYINGQCFIGTPQVIKEIEVKLQNLTPKPTKTR